jgi:hypothetical protein
MKNRIDRLPPGAMAFSPNIPEQVNINTGRLNIVEKDLYGDEKSDEIGICKKVNQMYKSWTVSTVILKWIFPIVSAVIILLLGIIINKLFGS